MAIWVCVDPEVSQDLGINKLFYQNVDFNLMYAQCPTSHSWTKITAAVQKYPNMVSGRVLYITKKHFAFGENKLLLYLWHIAFPALYLLAPLIFVM